MGKVCPSMEGASPMKEIKQKALLDDREIKEASQITPEEYGPYWWLNILRRNAQAQLDKAWDIAYMAGWRKGNELKQKRLDVKLDRARKEGKRELFDAIMERMNKGENLEALRGEIELEE